MPKYAALVNLRSGGRRAAEYVLRKLRERLGQEHVWVLFNTGDEERDHAELERFLRNESPKFVVVAGGDGTISFVMDVVKKLHSTRLLADDRGIIAPFPLGTGNDLSFTLGFGSGFARWFVLGGVRFRRLFRSYETATVTKVDRWSLQVSTTTAQQQQQPVEHSYILNNYFSIGFDAAVANRLNQFRKKHPHLFVTRPVVKLWYAAFAAIVLFSEKKIGATVALTIDGQRVVVPRSAKAVAVCNMLSYAGGAVAWNGGARDCYTKPSVCDGKVEIVCFYGIWHLALVRLGWCYGRKLGQGSRVEIATACHSCQFDGEEVSDVVDAAGTAIIRIERYTDSDCLTVPPPSETNLLAVALVVAALLLAFCYKSAF
ncbi:diacylglycerol kinase-like protein [Leptomonas pyrrhocoris]|uniref:Diacylglycerol kinase n=1 Tax=Leptomonas pyrrhocoris TaxID=157538 RepID=A0A0N0VHX1_LEPPY|nr:diacylglycerol kinase-like protein [Leptomonas pyrrhocoris]KPA86681.1 diacylglycerol kinase-like protein [Leptomonas pyrrhocoris]|eukprot:XP_015665120.1 diacylglycerol kinase-like protein [Leptomonas pyrrhocoris]